MPNWSELPASDKIVLIGLYQEEGGESPDFITHCNDIGILPSTAGRYVRFLNHDLSTYEAMDMLPGMPYFTEEHKPGNIIQIPAIVPRARLTDYEQVERDSDAHKWVTWLEERARSNPEMTVMHLCDIHQPFADPAALELAYQMVKEAQPTVIVVGSDFGDLYLSSSFDNDPDLADYDDELDCYEYYWRQHIKRLRAACPNAIFIFIYGNHEQRLIRKLIRDAKGYRKRVMRDFRQLIQFGGQVMYLGDNITHARMGPLHVEHGIRHNDHVTKSRLIDLGGQVSVMMGHVHKRNFYSLAGADFDVEGISSGSLSPPNPHYQFGSVKSGRGWEQGTAVATFNLLERGVEFENVKFTNINNTKMCYFRGQRLETERIQIKVPKAI